MVQQHALTPAEKRLFLLVLTIASIGQVAADLYLPSLPAISQSLNTTVNLTQLSVSAYMYGACSLFLYGIFSDAFGRRWPVIIGLIIMIIGGIICVFAPSIHILILGRVLQGIGAGASFAVTRSILRDVAHGNKLAKLFAYISIGNTFLIASAPLVGGYVQEYIDWRANFVLLALYTAVVLMIIVKLLPETSTTHDAANIKPTNIVNNLITVLKSPILWGSSLIIFFAYGGMLAWLTAGSVVLQEKFQFTPVEFGWTATALGFTYAVGALLNARLVVQHGTHRMLCCGISLMLLAGILMLSLSLLVNSSISVIFPVAIYIFGVGMVFANAFSCAMTPFAKIAGFAASFISLLQILGGAIASNLMAYAPDNSVLPLASMLVLISCFAFFALILLIIGSRYQHMAS